eukprot:5856144-Prymnesium_polylepis.2
MSLESRRRACSITGCAPGRFPSKTSPILSSTHSVGISRRSIAATASIASSGRYSGDGTLDTRRWNRRWEPMWSATR